MQADDLLEISAGVPSLEKLEMAPLTQLLERVSHVNEQTPAPAECKPSCLASLARIFKDVRAHRTISPRRIDKTSPSQTPESRCLPIQRWKMLGRMPRSIVQWEESGAVTNGESYPCRFSRRALFQVMLCC